MADSLVENLTASPALAGTEYLYGYNGSNDVYVRPSQVGDYVLARADTAELIRDTIGATLVAGSNVTITVDDSPNTITIASTGGGSSAFSAITGATNTTAAMVVGTGASLATSGSGTIAATSAPASGITGATLAAGVTGSSLTSVGTLTGLAIAGTGTITSSSATALTVGANGATNPALTVDASTASSVTGISVKSAASGGGVSITATSSAAAESLTIGCKGSAQMNLQTNGNTRITIGTNTMTFAPASRSGTAAAEYTFTASNGTTLTASTEAPIVNFNLGASTQSHNTGALTLQRDFRISATSHLFVASSTITNAATLAVDSAPIASTNATITNSSSIYSPGGAVGSGVTTSYGLNIVANTGGTNNYVARLAGGAVFMEDITAPSATPSGGGFLYVEAGALKYKGSSGTVTTIAVA